MELAESIERINEWLKRDYGLYLNSGRPKFRVVWAQDQIEKRKVHHTKDGFTLLTPIVTEIVKYSYIRERYILERIVNLAPGVDDDLVEREPYEVMWTFEDRFQNYLPPSFLACKFIIEQVYENKHKGIRKITNPDDLIEEEQRIDDMEARLFGNETPVGDALAYGHGVTVPDMTSTKEEKEKVH